MNANAIKLRFAYYVGNHAGLYPPSKKAHGIYVNLLNKACHGDANRKLVLKYLTGKTSTKLLDESEWNALKVFCEGTPAKAVSPAYLEQMCKVILGEVVKQEGQLTMKEVETLRELGFSAEMVRAADYHVVMAQIESEKK